MSKPAFLDIKSDFKEKVERLFNQLTARGFGANNAATYALKLAGDRVEALVDPSELLALAQQAAGQQWDYPADDARYAPVFSLLASQEVLVTSFSRASPDVAPAASEPGDASEPALDLDFERLDEVYLAFTRTDNRGLLDALAQACQDLMTGAKMSTGPLSVQAAAALLQNLQWDDPEWDWLAGGILGTIPTWKCSMQDDLVKLLATYPRDRLQALVQRTQQVLTFALLEERPDMEVQNAVSFLGLLYEANEQGRQLPISEFYNDAVNDEEFVTENMKQDYLAWASGSQEDPLLERFTFYGFPFVYEAATKAAILGYANSAARCNEFRGALMDGMSRGGASMPYLLLRVRRGQHLVHDTLLQLQNAGAAIRRPLKVHFIGEEGVDEGGVQKEFFQLLMRELFDPQYGMFALEPNTRTHYFRPSSLELQMEFELVGLLLGLAVYNNHILEVSFPPVVYKLLMKKAVGLDDLAEVAPEVHASLGKLLGYPADVLEQLGLFFQVEQAEEFGEGTRAVDLCPKGGETPVTLQNRQQYVDAYVQHLLVKSVRRQMRAFCRGFHKIWSGPLLFDLFHPEELEGLVCGATELDFSALQRGTRYDDGFSRDSQVIAWFWEVAHGFTEGQKKRLLAFVTGSDRVPLRGLAALQPPLVISRNGGASNRLPTAHTCFNHLLLPAYADKATLQDRLETAINNAEGFGLR